jgi:hypothetical protein
MRRRLRVREQQGHPIELERLARALLAAAREVTGQELKSAVASAEVRHDG